MATDLSLYAVDKFYPIRIAHPNYGVLDGLPYLAVCGAAVYLLPRIGQQVASSAWRYAMLWGFSVVILLSFGGIHGGFVGGNLGIASSVHHLHDASINATVAETFATHTDRVAGLIEPGYQAPHSTSHPAASVVYWQLLIGSASPLGLSVVNVCIFALGLPVMLWALRRRFDDVTALQGALACLLVPALLVYGRSDDAVFYALVATLPHASLPGGVPLERRCRQGAPALPRTASFAMCHGGSTVAANGIQRQDLAVRSRWAGHGD